MLYRTSVFFIFLFFLSGCSNNFNSAIESVKLANEISSGVDITPQRIKNTPYASAIVTVNDAPPIFMVLAFAEKNTYNDYYQLTWAAADRGTLVTENGRIIRTTGISTANLESVRTSQKIIPFVGTQDQWKAIYDWSPGYRYNFSANITSTKIDTETLSSTLWSENTTHWSESVFFDGLDYQFENHYWVIQDHKHSRPRVVKSIQYLGPNMNRITMLITRLFIEPETKQQPLDSSEVVK